MAAILQTIFSHAFSGLYLERGMGGFPQISNLPPKFCEEWGQILPYLTKSYIAFVLNAPFPVDRTPFSEILRGISPLKFEAWIQPCIFMNEEFCIFIKISLKFVPNSLCQKLLSSLAIWANGKHWSTDPNQVLLAQIIDTTLFPQNFHMPVVRPCSLAQ